jgi:UDP-glucose 4-epimerase
MGDGTQSKSHLYVDDCVEGLIAGTEEPKERVDVLNIGAENRVNVMDTADIVTEEMGLEDVEIRLTGGIDGGRGWRGDVKLMRLDMSRLRSYGWEPRLSSD